MKKENLLLFKAVNVNNKFLIRSDSGEEYEPRKSTSLDTFRNIINIPKIKNLMCY